MKGPAQAQIDIVLAALRAGTVTSLQMIKLHGITRLASCVHLLRQDGYAITTTIQRVRTRHRTNASIAEYRLTNRRRGSNRVAARLDGKAVAPIRRVRAAKPRTRNRRSA